MIKAEPYDWPYDGQIDPTGLAALAIDLQRDFLSPQGYFARLGYDPGPLRAIIPAVNRVTRAVRGIGGLVIHTRQGYRADLADMTPFERWRRQRNGLDGTDALLRGSPGFEIEDDVEVLGGDVVVDKTCNGSFTHTDLEHILGARGITHLIIMGVTTEVCVHSTLREAVDRNYQCLTVLDACASGDFQNHEAALRMVTVEGGVFGSLATAAAVEAALARLEQAPRRTGR
ncbi:cysteine hydrolase family protein [Rubellimicrobium arenae]|uniref:cysteine hydrolase family protein n=1 Tax=Rubellimicrobium arenae TaxID=2817372 RepID=UPI001B312BD2|nr:isochorismatase family cysteine hydrolase [Rubellimicrobium arenae]